MKLYIDHYSEIHRGKTMSFAVREWILRDHHSFIVDDLKFLTRKWIDVILFHNIWVNRWNSRFIQENIVSKLPEKVDIRRIPWSKDLYEEVLATKQEVDKLIILERQFLVWENWDKINTISTNKLQHAIDDNDIHGLWIWNINFREDLLKICKSIELWNIRRVHVLPWWRKHAIKHELFSLEWTGTLIWNDFWKPSISDWSDFDEDIISWLLETHKWNEFLKPRKKEYISENISNFRVATIDGIPVWCVEIIEINEGTIELWALSVAKSFLSLKVWLALVKYVQEYGNVNWKDIISLTNNIKLQKIYERMWFIEDKEWIYKERAQKSPGVNLYILNYLDNIL